MKRKYTKSIIGCIIWLFAMCAVMKPTYSRAAGLDFNGVIVQLQNKFPNGAYWNHVGSATDNVDGYTNTPCPSHGVSGVDHVNGTGGCTCNHYMDTVEPKHNGSTQCMGFANKLGRDVFGATTWTRNTSNPVANIKPGDIVRFQISYSNGSTSEHSVFVASRVGNAISVGECNYTNRANGCLISWGRTIDLTESTVVYYDRADNYDGVMTGAVVPATPAEPQNPATPETPATPQSPATPETPATPGTSEPSTNSGNTTQNGWVMAADRVHEIYYENGTMKANTWLTVDGKRFYVDGNGYKLTGFVIVDGYLRYFDQINGAPIDTWFTVDGQDYYSNEDCIVRTNRWLYMKRIGMNVWVTDTGAVAKNQMLDIDGNTYFFNGDGSRSKGFKSYEGDHYYCNKNGIVKKKKWIVKGKNRYYLQKSGVRAESKIVKIKGVRYYFNGSGKMVKNKKVTYKGKQYKANRYGVCKFLRNID